MSYLLCVALRVKCLGATRPTTLRLADPQLLGDSLQTTRLPEQILDQLGFAVAWLEVIKAGPRFVGEINLMSLCHGRPCGRCDVGDANEQYFTGSISPRQAKYLCFFEIRTIAHDRPCGPIAAGGLTSRGPSQRPTRAISVAVAASGRSATTVADRALACCSNARHDHGATTCVT